MEGYLDLSSEIVMQKHGKSFYFASQIFSEKQFNQVADLYQFCRYVDDLADEFEPETSKRLLKSLRAELEQNSLSPDHEKLFRPLLNAGIKNSYMIELIDGALFDLFEGKIQTLQDLMVYCYQVAGVVGLMMCPLLGVKDASAQSHAIDLGIGMQLTNITRDILEDAQNNRCYIPQTILEDHSVSTRSLELKGATPENLKTVIRFLLDRADQYYFSARKGFAFIPFRPRLAILIASEVYRSIGKKIRNQDFNVLSGRTYLSTTEKVLVSLGCLRFLLHPNFWMKKSHKSGMHSLINHLPGTNRG